MSQVKIQGGASGSDNYTILAPATSTGDKTLTLPTATATLASTDANTFTGVQTFPAGSVSAPAITTTGDTNTGVYFPGADSVAITTGGTAAVTVDSGQRTKFPTTIGVGNATPSTSGSGITFPATQSASSDANTLDDYEEGTWTCAITTGSGSITMNSSYDTGAYTKVGRMVTITGEFRVSSAATPSGTASIALPFTVAAATERSTYSVASLWLEGGSQNMNTYLMIAFPSTTNLYLYKMGTTSYTSAADTFSGDEVFFINITYATT